MRHNLAGRRASTNSWPATTMHCAYGMNAVYDHGHHGNALVSSFPIASSRNQDVSDHAYEARGILHCVVQMQ